MSNPHHVTPTQEAATAPYNFVPLPQAVFEVEDRSEWARGDRKLWACFDQFPPSTFSGRIKITLATLTPLFVAESRDKERGQALAARGADGMPVIPGSSLRGLTRAIVEILSFSKPGLITGERPFFRSVGVGTLGNEYRARMVKNDTRPSAGFLRKMGREWQILPTRHTRIPRTLLGGRQTGDQIFVAEGADGKISRCSIQPGDGLNPARLVCTGPMQGKKSEFVFFDRSASDAAPVDIPQSVLERFLSDDQITQYQEKKFPKGPGRERAGGIKDGDPVFYIVNDDALKNQANPEGMFFGRAGMFRLPYPKSPRDLVPERIRNAKTDIAEALFGTVPVRGQSGTTIRGRIRFSDLHLTGPAPMLSNTQVLLSSPKPTCYPHYLTQDETRDKQNLSTYLDGFETVIRGAKLYWHTPGPRKLPPSDKSSQVTEMRGVLPAHTQLTGEIHFINLNSIEVGALIAALQLPGGHAHKLGMAKPLGFGSVRIESELHLIDRGPRYASWAESGDSPADAEPFIRAFTDAVVAHATGAGEAKAAGAGLRQIARLDCLCTMLEYPGPGTTRTAPMPLESFKAQRVLQSPHAVAGLPEPVWPGNPPRRLRGAGVDPAEPHRRGGSEPPERSARRGGPTAPSPPPSLAGQKFRWRVLPEKTKHGGAKFQRVDAPHLGIIKPGTPIPEGAETGKEFELWVAQTGDPWHLTVEPPEKPTPRGAAMGKR